MSLWSQEQNGLFLKAAKGEDQRNASEQIPVPFLVSSFTLLLCLSWLQSVLMIYKRGGSLVEGRDYSWGS